MKDVIRRQSKHMKQGKVLLVQVPNATGVPFVAMGIAYVGTFLAEHGYSVEVYDPNLTRTSASTISKSGDIDWDNIKDHLQLRTFTYVGIDCTNTNNVLKTYKIAQLVKAIDPCFFVFVGGVHATAVPEQSLQECEDIDAVVLGDGEETTLEMLDALSEGKELANVPGLCVRTKREPIRSPRRRHSENLDPYTIDRDLIHLNEYRRIWSDQNVNFHGFTDPAGFIITARRCPAHCTYCAQNINNFRMKSMEAVRSEILEIIEKYNCRRFYILDGTFNTSRKRILEFCESVADLSIEWFCFLRAVGLDSSLVKKMRDAGFVGTSLGLESSMQAVVDYYDKRVNVGEYREVIHLLQSCGAYVHGSFIVGAPIETCEMMLSSVAFAGTLGLDGVCFNLLSVYPGTALWDRLKDEGRLVMGGSWENYYHGTKGRPAAIFQHPLYSTKDLNIITHYCDYESRFLQKGTVYSKSRGRGIIDAVRNTRNIVLRWYYRQRVRLLGRRWNLRSGMCNVSVQQQETDDRSRGYLQYRREDHNCVKLMASILAPDLCSGCGACVGVCPTGALSIDSAVAHTPVLDEEKCNGCGLCYEVCPGKGYPVVEWARESCDDKTSTHPEYGPVRHYWLGHSTDPDIRAEAASGGIATSLLLHLLKTKQVEAVVVTTLENGYPVVKLTDDPKVVLSAKMSKYSPVPMMEILGELRKRPRKIAMMVVGCQMGAFRLAAAKSKRLRECLVLAVGLFCGQVQTYESVSAIASTLGVDYPGGAEFKGWRCGFYPGSARFELPDGTVEEKALYASYDVAIPHFALNRCFLCPDGGNWLADMTLGDIHSGGTDETVIVCRTKRAEEMLHSAQDAGVIEFNDMTEEQVRHCVIRHITRSKLYPAVARIAWLARRGKTVPEYDYPVAELLSQPVGRLRAIFVLKYRLCMWVRKGWKRRFLLAHPWLLEKVGHFLYRFPDSVPGFSLAIRTVKKVMRMTRRP